MSNLIAAPRSTPFRPIKLGTIDVREGSAIARRRLDHPQEGPLVGLPRRLA